MNSININSERLAYWYLRFNGFLTTANFIVHPETGHKQRTDVDVLGCRFPFRSELLENPMIDEKIFIRGKIFIVIAEVKRSMCRINGPWTNPENLNMQRVIRAIGAFPEKEVDQIANGLYKNGFYENETAIISLLCLGASINTELEIRYPLVPQILWHEILSFIFLRFRSYQSQKIEHPQWDRDGHLLWNLVIESDNVDEFISKIIIL